MQIIARQSLRAALIGPAFDPEGECQEELNAFASGILLDAPEDVTHFVFTDNENSADVTVTWDSGDHVGSQTEVLIPTTYTTSGTSYYGMTRSVSKYDPDRKRATYDCYLGGSPMNSAPGFVISCATVLA